MLDEVSRSGTLLCVPGSGFLSALSLLSCPFVSLTQVRVCTDLYVCSLNMFQDETKSGVERVLEGHGSEVTSVKFLPLPSSSTSAGQASTSSHKGSGELLFVSGDRDGRLIFWRRSTVGAQVRKLPCLLCCSSSVPDFNLACLTFRRQWERAAVLPQEHAGSVTAITALSDFSTERSSGESYLVLTAGSDAKVHVWTWDVQSAADSTFGRS